MEDSSSRAVGMWATGALPVVHISTASTARWSDRHLLREVYLSRRPIVQGLVRPLVGIEVEVARKAFASLAGIGIVVKVHFFVFDRPPQALSENVIYETPAAVHADLNLRRLEPLGVLRTGEVTPLVAVPDDRHGLRQRPIDGAQHEGHFEGLVQLPVDHIARVPVQDGDQVQPAGAQANVGYVYAPNVIGVAGRDSAQ